MAHTAVSLAKNAAVSVAASAALCKGASFGPKTVFRPTTMSLAMERAGILPGTHIVSERARSGLLRHNLDGDNSYHSVAVAL